MIMIGNRSRRPDDVRALLAGIGVGVAAMYFLDPDRGGRRRALIRDQAVRALRSTRRSVRDRAVDVRNRAAGKVTELRNARSEARPSDEQLIARVRSELGHHVEHVRPIQVTAENGRVVLRGPVLREELDDVLAAVRSVRGVSDVDNQLEVHDAPAATPALQGEG